MDERSGGAFGVPGLAVRMLVHDPAGTERALVLGGQLEGLLFSMVPRADVLAASLGPIGFGPVEPVADHRYAL
jgi:hypothetical protein